MLILTHFTQCDIQYANAACDILELFVVQCSLVKKVPQCTLVKSMHSAKT